MRYHGALLLLLPVAFLATGTACSRRPAPDRFTELQRRAEGQRATPAEKVELAELYLARKEPLKAAENAFAARKEAPGIAGADNILGIVYSEAGDVEKARSAFNRAISVAPSATAPKLNLAKLEISAGYPQRALELLSEAAKQEPESAQLWLLTGTAQNQLQRLHLAAESYRRAIKLNPRLSEPHAVLGRMHLDFNRYREALKHLEEAYRLGDHSPITCVYLALALATTGGDLIRAAKLLDEAERPQIPPAWYVEGVIFQKQGKLPEAQAAFEKVLRAEPRQERAQYALAECLRLRGNVKRAALELERYQRMVTERQRVTFLRDRLTAEGENPKLLREYGRALLKIGRYDEAETQFSRWLTLSPASAEAKELLQQARSHKGETELQR
ncbi:MAG: tetratricopeptide repeat protein [Actinomycetota bacterium]